MKFGKLDFEKLIRKSFLKFVSDAEISQITKLGQVLEVEAFQRVPREEQPQHFFLVLEGEMTLRQRGSLFEVDRLSFGQSLELKVLLLHGTQWQYEWQCESKCYFLKLPWNPIELILQKYPVQLQYLARITQSVALQRLKRDLIGLNVSRDTVTELISRMTQEKFSDLDLSYQTERMIVTVFTGEVVVQVEAGERPFHLMTLSAGDTTLIDRSRTHLKYIPQEHTKVWVVSETDLQSVVLRADLQNFLELFKKKMVHERILSEPELTRTLAVHSHAHSSESQSEHCQVGAPPSRSRLSNLWWKIRRSSLLGSVDENRTGTALLFFLLKQAGVSARHRDIDAKSPDEWNDTTFGDFQQKCAKVGVICTAQDLITLNPEIKNQKIIVQTQTGFCLLYGKKRGFWSLADFSMGVYRDVTSEELMSQLKFKKCLVVQEIQNLFPKLSKEFGIFQLIRFLKADPSVLVFLVMGSCLGFITELSLPVFSQYILDQVVTSGHVALLNPLIAVFAVLTVLGILVSWFNQSHNSYLTNLLTLRMKAFFQSAMFRLSPMSIHNMGASQMMSRISDIDQLSGYVVNQLFGSCLSLIFMIGNLSVLWIYSPRLVGLVFLLLPIGAGITLAMKSKIENLKLEQVRTKARENRLILEHFSSNDDMRTLKGALSSRWKWDFNSSLFARNLVSNQKIQALFQIVQLIGTEGVKMVSFFYSFHLYSDGKMSLGQVIAVVMIVPRVIDPIQGIVSTIYQYFSNRILISRLNDLLVEAPSTIDPRSLKSVSFQQSMKFDDVSLQYDQSSSRTVLKNLSFEIKQGEKVAFMGSTGAGKSTLSYLMAGLYEASKGSVLYDGATKSQIDPKIFYAKVSLVEQDGRLFSGSILDNIALGDDRPDLEKVIRCAKAVVMDEDILARPGGYGSLLSHGGVGLSEGQKQRLLIARALYKDPQILILDESTSYLDPISESQVMKNVLEMMKDRTAIFFTQRIQVTSKVERVFFIEDGSLIESGSHKELIHSKQNYFNFYLKHLSIG